MKAKARLYKKQIRCVLAFVEMYLSNRMDIEKTSETVGGPCKTCQTVIARGIIAHWKQPVYFDFDQPMTAQIINEIISELFQANFMLCYFQHLSDKFSNIYVIADTHHLLKSTKIIW